MPSFLFKDKIGYDELIKYFKKLDIEITQNEAKKLVEKYFKNHF